MMTATAIILVVAASIIGRVPERVFPLPYILWFILGSAVVALLLRAAALRMPRFAGIALLALMALSFIPGTLRTPFDRPNVLWILVDTARRDHISPFGAVVSTPASEKLAREGVLFNDAVTVVPKTPNSVASFFTAQYPTHHGVRGLYDHLVPTAETVAEVFSANGYKTVAFVNNGWLSRGRGFAQGFRKFYGYDELHRPYGPLRYSSWTVLVDWVTRRAIRPFSPQTSARTLTDRVEKFLETELDDRPFLAYVHYFEPHWPYFPPPELALRYGGPPDGKCLVNLIQHTAIGRGRMIFQNTLPAEENETGRRLYKGEMDNTMQEIGRLLETLDRQGLAKNTIVVFTADHGHSLGDHEYYFHHGAFLYDASVQIPLILRWPAGLPAGLVIDSQVRSIDVAPTLAELAGIEWFPRSDGRSLVPFLTSANEAPREAFLESDVKMFSSNTRREFGGIPGKLRGLRDGKYKLILHPTPAGPEFELYDLEADPQESENLVDHPEYAEIREGLTTRLWMLIPADERQQLEEVARAARKAKDGQRSLSEQEEQMLRSLGYIQ
jgi:arylsulfatase A-like enzyme